MTQKYIFLETDQLGKNIGEANMKINIVPWQRSWHLPTAFITA